MQKQHNHKHKAHKQPMISFMEVITLLWLKKKTILICCGISLVLSIIYAFSLPKEYTGFTSLMPEARRMGGGSELAAIMGVSSTPQTNDAYPIEVYPDIVNSIPFVVGLFDVELQTSDNDSTFTLREILENRTKAPWWGSVIGGIASIFSSSDDDEQMAKGAGELVDPFRLTKEEMDLIKTIQNRINIDIDDKSGEVDVLATLQDPVAAAQLADTVSVRLQEYITDYRTAKARNDLDYNLRLNEEAKETYYAAQQRYAEYQDANQGLATYSATTTRDRLQNEMSLAFNIYNQSCMKVRSCEVAVQDMTPVFAVVDPATVPLLPSEPRKKYIVMVGLVLGFFVGCCIVLYKPFIGDEFKRALRFDRKMLARQEAEEHADDSEYNLEEEQIEVTPDNPDDDKIKYL